MLLRDAEFCCLFYFLSDGAKLNFVSESSGSCSLLYICDGADIWGGKNRSLVCVIG